MFNKSKPYGEVCGPGMAYRYEQAGKYYDHHLNEVTEAGVPVPGGEYILPEDESKPTTSVDIAQAEPESPYKNTLAVGGEESSPVPETEIPLPDSKASDVEDLDSLQLPEIREQLDRLGVKYDKKGRKADLKAVLAAELASQAVEDEIDQCEQEAEEGAE